MTKQNNQVSVRVDDHTNRLLMEAAEKAGIVKSDFIRKIIAEHFDKNIIIERIDRLEKALGNLNFDATAAIAGLTEGEKEAARNEVNAIYQDEVLS